MKGGNKSKAKADNKLSVKKGGAAKPAAKPMTKKDKAAAKDPLKPKRPASAFFVFMEDFRKTYKEKHPNSKSVADVGKAGGARWKQLTKEEKTPYVEKAEKRKVEYEKNMKAYNKRQAEGPPPEEEDEAESEKSQSEVNDEDDDEDGSDEDEDDE